jgi:hypothetical protein
MARRMTLEGAKVKMVLELMPYSGGLFAQHSAVPRRLWHTLRLSHTVSALHGKERLSGVTVAAVGKDLKPIARHGGIRAVRHIAAFGGVIPENELSHGLGLLIDPVTGRAGSGQRHADDSPRSIPHAAYAVQVHGTLRTTSAKEAARAGAGKPPNTAGARSQSSITNTTRGTGVKVCSATAH